MQRNVKRDNSIIKFVCDFRVASFSTLQQLFFNNKSKRTAYQVMKRLVEYGELNNERHFYNNENIYWIPGGKPKQLKHDLLRSEFYKHMDKHFNIAKFESEFTFFDGIRPDAFLGFETQKGSKHYAFLEVEISNNQFNTDKYSKLYNSGKWKEYMSNFPMVIGVTNKKRLKQDPNFMIVTVNEVFEDFNNIIKKIEEK